MFMALGPARFDIQSIPATGLSRKSSKRKSEKPVGQSAPLKQFLGPNNDEITITAVIFPEDLSPLGEAQLEALHGLAKTKDPAVFIAETGTYFGRWSVDEVGDTKTHFQAGTGRALKIEVEVTMSADPSAAGQGSALFSFLSNALSGVL